jgi:6-phosphogluconolactonase (cycloisomerase 2 family)
MKIGSWTRLLLAAAPVLACFLTGCGDFWQAPGGGSSSSFTLTNGGNILVGLSASGSTTITVTPGSSFTGTVALTCAVTTSMSNATDPGCSLSPTSETTSGTSTLTVTTTSSSPATTAGIYHVTVTGTSGSLTPVNTAVCVDVTTSTTNSCTSTASASGDFYILGSSSIGGYSINSSALTPLSGSPTPLPSAATPWAMAVDPTGSYLYVSTDLDIFLYDIGSGGALTLNSSGTIPDASSYAIHFDTTGHWLLDASNTSAGPVLNAWPISITTGLPTLAAGVNVPARSLISGGSVAKGGIAISPDGKLVAVAVGSETQTFTFTSGTDFTGATNPLSTTFDFRTAIGTAISVAFDPNTKLLYIGETADFPSSATDSGGLRLIPIASDVLGTEPAASSTYPYPSGGTGPHAILAASNGYVYVANEVSTGAGNVTAFLVDEASTPSLTLQSNPAATGDVPSGMAVDNSGDFVIVINSQGTSPVDAYTFDATTTGLLDPVSLTGSAGSNPVAIVAVPK